MDATYSSLAKGDYSPPSPNPHTSEIELHFFMNPTRASFVDSNRELVSQMVVGQDRVMQRQLITPSPAAIFTLHSGFGADERTDVH